MCSHSPALRPRAGAANESDDCGCEGEKQVAHAMPAASLAWLEDWLRLADSVRGQCVFEESATARLGVYGIEFLRRATLHRMSPRVAFLCSGAARVLEQYLDTLPRAGLADASLRLPAALQERGEALALLADSVRGLIERMPESREAAEKTSNAILRALAGFRPGSNSHRVARIDLVPLYERLVCES